jgi:hypothetical protein
MAKLAAPLCKGACKYHDKIRYNVESPIVLTYSDKYRNNESLRCIQLVLSSISTKISQQKPENLAATELRKRYGKYIL